MQNRPHRGDRLRGLPFRTSAGAMADGVDEKPLSISRCRAPRAGPASYNGADHAFEPARVPAYPTPRGVGPLSLDPSDRAAGRNDLADVAHGATEADNGRRDVIAPAMARVDQVMRERLASRVALVDQIGHYIVGAGGKRVRPRLLLLFAQALGCHAPEREELAAVVEFIHTATLLHDDVVDESALRRGQPTANALFGNAASVLVGDFLYSRAFQMMVAVRDLRVLSVLADATNVIAEGEVLQLMNMRDPDLAVEAYLEVIRFKTAKLFEASARMGAILGGAAPALEEAAACFGRSLGTAFQLVDDLLDYDGSSQVLGKNLGDDLREGKPTLPLLVAMARCGAAEREMLRTAIREGGGERLGEVLAVVRATGAIEATRQAAQDEVDTAKAQLDGLPAGPERDALLELCLRVVDRSS